MVFFRLPDETDAGGSSLRDLAALDVPASPRLLLRQSAAEQLELANTSAFDLPPRLSGEKSDRDRGYALEIDAPAPVFREALAGDFWRVASHANPDAKKPIATVVPLATRLTFWFSQLRAGATLRTGLLQLAPGASLDRRSLSNHPLRRICPMETALSPRHARASTMKHRRLPRILLMLAAAITLAAHRSRATGDFYEQPLQTLSDYLKLDQLPAKSFQQIEDETRKPPADGAKINFKAELEALPKMTGAEALASIDKMIAAARADGANPLLNLLNDVRDLFSGPAQALESIAYLKWRLNHAVEFGVDWEKNRKKPDAPTDEAAPAPGEGLGQRDRGRTGESLARDEAALALPGRRGSLSRTRGGGQPDVFSASW